jgi:tripartite-type tricarboxylate transporter receptor subunit TctC
MKQERWMRRGTIFLCAFLLVPALSYAQEYPARPINLVVASQTGSTLDIAIRALASKAEKFLGQPFIISAKAAGGGTVPLTELMKQKPDGYSLAMTTTTPLAFAPIFRRVPYTLEDFSLITSFARGTAMLVVRADSSWNTLKEFVEYARRNPGKIKYGSSGANTTKHMAMEVIGKQEGIKWVHVPYEGDPPGVVDLLGGHIHAMSDGATVFPHVQNGSFRLLAFYSSERSKKFTDVPTLMELGYNYRDDAIFLVAAPKGVPPAVIEKLDNAFRRGMEDPELIQVLEKLELKASYGSSHDTKRLLEDARSIYTKMGVDFKITREGEGIK